MGLRAVTEYGDWDYPGIKKGSVEEIFGIGYRTMEHILIIIVGICLLLLGTSMLPKRK